MIDPSGDWYPGSFTKNFSWARDNSEGLSLLHSHIRTGFNNEMQDVPRDTYRKRVKAIHLPELIPINFFLFNTIRHGVGFLIADELVFHAITRDYTPAFDQLALHALNLSFAGLWPTAKMGQRRPALWAYHYVRERVGKQLNWNTERVTAADIAAYIEGSPLYRGETRTKLSTNLNFLYKHGRLSEFASAKVTQWWVDALFLTLDRIISDLALDGVVPAEGDYDHLLKRAGFYELTGKNSIEKRLAARHLIDLYIACGGRERFSEAAVLSRTRNLPDMHNYISNDPDPRPKGAVHPSNVNTLKSIPTACAMLARYARFDVIDADELATFDVTEYVRRKAREALEAHRESGIRPSMTADELLRITRDR